MRRVLFTIITILAVAAGPVLADPVDGKTARKELFKTSAMIVKPVDAAGLSPALAAQAEKVVAGISSRANLKMLAASGFNYYGAVAIPTGVDSLKPEHLTMTANLHSPQAAEEAALATCQQAHETCAVVALMLPKGYKARPLSLSQAASAAFFSGWNKGQGPKFLAYSPSTDAWVIAKGQGADAVALERCNETGGAGDCEIAVSDP